MKKISRLLLIIMVLITGAAIAEAQQPKVPRIVCKIQQQTADTAFND